jgi:hypothetical protein
MAREIVFTRAIVGAVQFEQLPDGHARLSGSGQLMSDAGEFLGVAIFGWDGISESVQVSVRSALAALMFEVVASELSLGSGDGIVTDGDARTFRQALDGETPIWVKP